MATGQITANETSRWQYVPNNGEGVHLSLQGDFGGGEIGVFHAIDGILYPLLEVGVALTYTAPADDLIKVMPGDILALTMTGGTSPNIVFNMGGAILLG